MAEKRERKKKTEKKKDSEEVCEVFEVGKEGKEKIKEACGEEEIHHSSKKQIEEQNKTLKKVLIILGILSIIFIAGVLFVYSLRFFNYEGVKFEIVKQCGIGNSNCLILYKTAIPVVYNGKIVPYNFYLRNDPRKLGGIVVDGNVSLSENAVVNLKSDFNCNGDGMIGLANLVNLYKVLGINTIKDENASCDKLGRYIYLNIEEGNSTKIEQTGPKCYNIQVSNCEILKATEKFMLEYFVKINSQKSA
jgi:hypothetical protein